MKKNFTKIAFGLAAMFLAGTANSATITATVSGNWSNANTWSGGAAGATVSGIDNIVIPAGITVTLDMDVSVTSLFSSISVAGTLNSTSTNSLMINQGTLSGNGSMNLHYLELSTTGGMSFSGGLNVSRFATSNINLNLASQVTLTDTLYLNAGTLTLGTGSLLMLNTNSNIKVDDGSLTIGSGIFTATNDYNVMYVGSSKTTGIEMNGAGFKNLYVNLSSASQDLSLGSNTTVNGVLYHTVGTLNLNGKSLKLKNNYISFNNSQLSGSNTSTLTVETISSPSAFKFAAGSRMLNDFSVNPYNLNSTVTLESDLAISGTLYLERTLMVDNNSTLTMNAGSDVTVRRGDISLLAGSVFNGTAAYNVKYIDLSTTSGLELTGSGLNNVSLDMSSSTSTITMNSNTTINGMLMLNKGSLYLNNNKLTLKGGLSSTTDGWLRGTSTSDLEINTTGSLGDTLKFESGSGSLNSLIINTGNGSNVMLDNDLILENLTLTNGGLTIYDNDLMINSTGAITGSSTNRFVMIKGDGKLMMNVNTSSPFVMFPVGTTTGFAPAYIQRNSGTNAMLGVNTYDGVWGMGLLNSGSNMAGSLSIVDRTWDISSASTSSVDMNVKFEWPTAMEINGFNRNMAYVSQYTNNWDMTAPGTSTVTGGTFQMMRNGITSPGQFAVVDNLSALSVKEKEEVTFSLYPNPAHNNLTVSVKDNEGFTVEVYDALGNKTVAEKSINGKSTEIDFSTLSAGVYFVKISNDKAQSIRRVVKQ
jgi:hypothetical protein